MASPVGRVVTTHVLALSLHVIRQQSKETIKPCKAVLDVKQLALLHNHRCDEEDEFDGRVSGKVAQLVISIEEDILSVVQASEIPEQKRILLVVVRSIFIHVTARRSTLLWKTA